jgi:hypothetical protein
MQLKIILISLSMYVNNNLQVTFLTIEVSITHPITFHFHCAEI